MKIAVITCYFDPDYVRARSLRAALASLPDVEVVVCKNKHKGMLRYPEMLWKIWRLKHREKPDVYLLTFRGFEILPYVLFLARKKPVWFDELIVPLAYAKNEKHKKTLAIRVKYAIINIAGPLYERWLRRCQFIIADTTTHAQLSAATSKVPLEKYLALPVGTDETLFKPSTRPKSRPAGSPFQLFYYGNMLPLHGMPTILKAAELLAGEADISFLIVGNKKNVVTQVQQSMAKGARIEHRPRVPFNELPNLMYNCDLFLAGPYGGTKQANSVVTGKAFQALACGVPTLIGASPSTDEYFTDRLNTVVVEQANPEALVAAIHWAKDHPQELATIAANGRKLYEAEFSTPMLARRLQPLVDAAKH